MIECCRFGLVLALTATLVAPSPSRGESKDHLADLEGLREWIDLEGSFSDETRKAAESAIDAHLEGGTEFTDAGFYMELRRIVGLADNGHSNVTASPIYETFGLVPLRFYWFADGPYVVRAHESFEKLVGMRIDSIDGKTVEELEASLSEFHSGSDEYFRRYGAMPLMLCPPLLHAVGLAKHADRIALGLIDSDGERITLEVPLNPQAGGGRGSPWRYLNPTPLDGETGWVTVHDQESDVAPYLRDAGQGFRYELLEDGRLAYIQLRSNYAWSGVTAREFAKTTRKRLEADKPHSIVLDNRQNPGGDLGRTADLALALPSLTREGGKVFVLTDNATFSAGIYTSFFPQAADGDKTIVIGERVGDDERFWAETGSPFRLPKSGYRIGYATQLHDLGEGCREAGRCHLAGPYFNPSWNIAVGSLDPEQIVPTRFADYAAGRDRPFERVLAELEAIDSPAP